MKTPSHINHYNLHRTLDNIIYFHINGTPTSFHLLFVQGLIFKWQISSSCHGKWRQRWKKTNFNRYFWTNSKLYCIRKFMFWFLIVDFSGFIYLIITNWIFWQDDCTGGRVKRSPVHAEGDMIWTKCNPAESQWEISLQTTKFKLMKVLSHPAHAKSKCYTVGGDWTGFLEDVQPLIQEAGAIHLNNTEKLNTVVVRSEALQACLNCESSYCGVCVCVCVSTSPACLWLQCGL